MLFKLTCLGSMVKPGKEASKIDHPAEFQWNQMLNVFAEEILVTLKLKLLLSLTTIATDQHHGEVQMAGSIECKTVTPKLRIQAYYALG